MSGCRQNSRTLEFSNRRIPPDLEATFQIYSSSSTSNSPSVDLRSFFSTGRWIDIYIYIQTSRLSSSSACIQPTCTMQKFEPVLNRQRKPSKPREKMTIICQFMGNKCPSMIARGGGLSSFRNVAELKYVLWNSAST